MSKIKLKPFGSSNPEAAYIGWSPIQLQIEGVNPSGNNSVILRSRSINGAISRVVFMDKAGAVPADEVTINLGPENRHSILVSGKFQPGQRHNGASEDGKDVLIEAVWTNQPQEVVGSLEVMIRIRKDANDLSEKARNDFLEALAFLNGIGEFPAAGAGRGIYVTDFVGMHVDGAYDIGHGDSHFLPWHRLYLLDLERLLQKVNPAVTLPYWRFDKTAEQLFTEDFMGATEQIPNNTPFTQGWSDKLARFSSANPISGWKIGEVNGIRRAAYFDTINERAFGLPAEATPDPDDTAFKLINEIATLTLGGADSPAMGTRRRGTQDGFSEMEGTPHGAAHTSFNGPINAVPVAPRDPLFFLLHCNVDRIWALWQFVFDRYEIREKESYPYQERLEILGGSRGLISGTFPDFWKVLDTPQWPWDSGLSKPGHLRPPGTRSGNFTRSSAGGKNLSDRPPRLSDTIDSFGLHTSANFLGFGYDDVPFGHDRKLEQFVDLSSSTSDNQIVVISDYRKDYQAKINEAEGNERVINDATEKILEIARDASEVDKLIGIINDPASSVDERVTAIDSLNIVSNFSQEVRSRMPEIVNALRGMMTSANETLRIRALSTLAMMKDEVAQELLLEELNSDKNEEDKLVPTSVAISMLGRDEKALPAPLLRKIAENPPTPESREEAVRHMSADLESFQVLKEIMEDDSNSLEVRAMIPEMINNVDAPVFLKIASDQLQSRGSDHDLAPFLAKGIAGVTDPNAEVQATEAKAMIRKLKNDAPESFRRAAGELFEKDDDESKLKKGEIWNNRKPHE